MGYTTHLGQKRLGFFSTAVLRGIISSLRLRTGFFTITPVTELPAWKNYQEQAREFFCGLGLEARADAEIKGVRAIHAVDVYISFARFGIEHRWLVECKFWKTAIPKEKVLAFQSVMTDIGADKGFLLSETGFQ